MDRKAIITKHKLIIICMAITVLVMAGFGAIRLSALTQGIPEDLPTSGIEVKVENSSDASVTIGDTVTLNVTLTNPTAVKYANPFYLYFDIPGVTSYTVTGKNIKNNSGDYYYDAVLDKYASYTFTVSFEASSEMTGISTVKVGVKSGKVANTGGIGSLEVMVSPVRLENVTFNKSAYKPGETGTVTFDAVNLGNRSVSVESISVTADEGSGITDITAVSDEISSIAEGQKETIKYSFVVHEGMPTNTYGLNISLDGSIGDVDYSASAKTDKISMCNLIMNAEQLAEAFGSGTNSLAAKYAAGSTDTTYKDWEIGADIDMSEYTGTWTPIPTFNGTLDGQNHTISNLTIKNAASNQGLTGALNGTVKNLVLRDVTIDTFGTKGIAVGSNLGSVAGAMNTGSVIDNVAVIGLREIGDSQLGGLVGTMNGGTISNSLVSMQACRDGNGLFSANFAGAIIERNPTEAELLKMSSVGGEDIGGLVGIINTNTAVIENCFANVNALYGEYLGGLVGTAEKGGTIRNCYATGYLCGFHDVGGLFGRAITDVVVCDSIYSSVELDGFGKYQHVAAIGHTGGVKFSADTSYIYQDIQMGTGGTNYIKTVNNTGLQLMIGTETAFFGKLNVIEGLFTKDMTTKGWYPGSTDGAPGDAWYTENGYYPQLKFFAENDNPLIRQASSTSAQAVFLANESDITTLIGRGSVDLPLATWDQIDTWKYVRQPFYTSRTAQNIPDAGTTDYNWSVSKELGEAAIEIEEKSFDTGNSVYLGHFITKERTEESLKLITSEPTGDNTCKKIFLFGADSGLVVEKTADKAIIDKNETITYTIKVTNTGGLPLRKIVLTDTWNDNFTIASLSALYNWVESKNVTEETCNNDYYWFVYISSMQEAKALVDSNSEDELKIRTAYNNLLESAAYLKLTEDKGSIYYQKVIGEIDTLESNSSKEFTYTKTITETRADGSAVSGGDEIYNTATARSGMIASQSSSIVKVAGEVTKQIVIRKHVSGNSPDSKLFVISLKDKNGLYDANAVIKDGEAWNASIPLGTYTVSEVIPMEYNFASGTIRLLDANGNELSSQTFTELPSTFNVTKNVACIQVDINNAYSHIPYFHMANYASNVLH